MSVNLHYEVVGEAPEGGGIGDAEHLVAVHVLDDIRVGGLVGEHLGLLGVEVDAGEGALVGGSEEGLVEVALHDFGFTEET